MALEVKVPGEIRDYEEKILGNFSVRQLGVLTVSFVLSIGIGVISYFFFHFSTDLMGFLIIPLNIPILAFGFFKKDGRTFEKWIALLFKYHMKPGVRKYQTNIYKGVDELVKNETKRRNRKNKKETEYFKQTKG